MPLSSLLPILVLALGTYLLFKLRFFFVLHPIRTIRDFLRSAGDRESRRSLFLALAGTLGVGNIFGVAAGIIYGGAGSVFWLVVSSFLASALKYAECVVSFDFLGDSEGGMHRVLLKSFSKSGRCLAQLYASSCILLALFMGGAMQTSAVSGAITAFLDFSPLLPLIIFALLVFFGVKCGVEKIDKITEKVIPLTMIVYIFLALATIIYNFPSLGDVLSRTMRDAFTPDATIGGVGAFFFSRGFTEGFARGILSNEAGCGTSSFAHTRAKERTPYIAGLSGICEVFFDTSVFCVLTALAILTAIDSPESYTSPMLLVSDAIGNTLGEPTRILLLLCVTAFAYSTVICWFFYGSLSAKFLFGTLGERIFAPIFFAFLVFGGSILPRAIIDFTDILLIILSVLTAAAIIRHSERIKKLTKF